MSEFFHVVLVYTRGVAFTGWAQSLGWARLPYRCSDPDGTLNSLTFIYSPSCSLFVPLTLHPTKKKSRPATNTDVVSSFSVLHFFLVAPNQCRSSRLSVQDLVERQSHNSLSPARRDNFPCTTWRGVCFSSSLPTTKTQTQTG